MLFHLASSPPRIPFRASAWSGAADQEANVVITPGFLSVPSGLTEILHVGIPWGPSNVSEGCHYHSLLTQNGLMHPTWPNPENVMPREVRQAQRQMLCGSAHRRLLGKSDS